ncbi:unnamed protein product [Cunninghamella blakesleeana]
MAQPYINEPENDNRQYQLANNNNNNNTDNIVNQNNHILNNIQYNSTTQKSNYRPCIHTNTNINNDNNNNIHTTQTPNTPIPTNSETFILLGENTPTPNTTSFISPTYNMHSHSINLSQHIYQRGLLEGIGSDIIVKVPTWNGIYRLHRLILDQNYYFQTLFQGGFQEASTNEITLYFEDQSLITSESFNFVLTRLYGKLCDPNINETNVKTILATCSFFHLDSMNELCVEFILHTLSTNNAIDYLLFADSHELYGNDRICDAIFLYLCRELYFMDRKKLIDIPIAWLKKIMSSDAFYVPSEYERYTVIKDIIQNHYEILWDERGLSSTYLSNTPMNYDNNTNFSEDDTISELANGFEKLSNLNTSSIILHHSINQNNEYNNDNDNDDQKSKTDDSDIDIDNDELLHTLEIYNDILCHSIYYMHMTFEQLEMIQDDMNPFNNDVMVPESIIKNALWNQIKLRTKVENATEKDKVLGISTADCFPNKMDNKINRIKRQFTEIQQQQILYCIPTSDSTKYTGETAISNPSTSNILLNSSIRSPISINNNNQSLHRSETVTLDENNNNSNKGNNESIQYSIYPPFRFSVEFTDVANLKRNVRVYSKTFFYAGSNWNMYIQKTRSQRRNLIQLGVYLHRQSIPCDNSNNNNHNNNNNLQVNINPNVITRTTNTTPVVFNSSQLSNNNIVSNQDSLNQDHSSSSFSCYKDKRKITKTWFKIFCPSRGPKHALTLFQSSPDNFKVLQSWGWRSTVLCADENNLGNRTSTSTGLDNQNNNIPTTTTRRDTDILTGIIPVSSSPIKYDINQHPSQSPSPETIQNDELNANQQTSPVTLRFSVVMGHL